MNTPIARRRKKPVEVATVQWLGDNEADVQAFAGGAARFYALDDEDRANSDDPEATATVYDKLHSTWILVCTGQHIVRGVKGELYPIAEDVLAETYDTVGDGAQPDRPCVCDETLHPVWCPASVPTAGRIAEIRQGVGAPLTARELAWLRGAAGRHELHVTGARIGEWPLTDDLPGALLLVSQYLAAAVAVIERADLVEEATASTTPDFFVPGRTYSREHHGDTIQFLVEHVSTSPEGRYRVAHGWRTRSWDPGWEPSDSDDFTIWVDVTGTEAAHG